LRSPKPGLWHLLLQQKINIDGNDPITPARHLNKNLLSKAWSRVWQGTTTEFVYLNPTHKFYLIAYGAGSSATS